MNPNEANPIAPTGNGAAPVPGAGSMDFTNPASLDAGNNGMTGGMVDDASAGSTNIDGTANDAITQMQPLVPADPVPGSIGSVTSVPPLAPEPMDVSAPATNVTTSNMPVMGQAAESKPAENAPASTGGSPYYNPFMRNNVNNSAAAEMKPEQPTSSTAVPTALQPKTDMFSEKLKNVSENKKPGHTMALVGWLLAALFLVTTVVFVVLWQGEANKKPEVVYYPSNDQRPDDEEDPNTPTEPDEPTEPVAAVLKCNKNIEAADGGMENVTSARGDVTANYVNDEMSDITVLMTTNFKDAEAAVAAMPTFETMKAVMDVMVDDGVTVALNQMDNVITYGVMLPANMLTAEGVSLSINLPTTEDGSVDTGLDALKAGMETDGYVCVTE